MKNFGYEVLEYHWLKERALSEYITWSFKAKAVTISANMNYVQPFPGLLSSFLSSIKSKNFRTRQSASSNSQEPNKGL